MQHGSSNIAPRRLGSNPSPSATGATMSKTSVDPARLAEELAADEEVIAALRDNGDVATLVRPVDVHFEGDEEAISRLEDEAEELGWTVVEVAEEEDGLFTLWIQREQTTTDAALRGLTEEALRLEADYGLSYDGWGTVAETGPE